MHKSIVTLGTWNWVWNGVNSGARQVVSVHRADPATIRGDGVGVWAMSAIAMYGEMDKQPHVLKAANVLLQFQKPIRSIKITNVVYDWDNKITISQGPSDLSAGALSYVDNCGETSDCIFFTQNSLKIKIFVSWVIKIIFVTSLSMFLFLQLVTRR